jgi:hypothetical protein
VLLAVTTAAGCGGQTDNVAPCTDLPSTVVEDRPVEVDHRGPVADSTSLLTSPPPRLVVQLTNNQPSVERVRLAFDGSEALDVDLPVGIGCNPGPSVFSVAYDPPPGPVDVQLDLQGATSTSTIDVPESGTVWAVVDVQSERAWGDLQVYDTQPSWG